MKSTHMLIDIPQYVTVFPNTVSFTQSELNFMLDGTRRSIQESYALRKQFRKVCSTLWMKCDKTNDETSDVYKEYIRFRTMLKRLNKDIKRMESISRKIKAQRQLVD